MTHGQELTRRQPWNHSIRVEQKVGPLLRVIAIIDPDAKRVADVLANKREQDVKAAYEKTRHFANLDDFINAMQSRGKKAWPKAIIVCSPPAFRGSDKPNRDAELKLLKGLPGVGMLVEKPISTDTVEVRPFSPPLLRGRR